MDRTPFLESQVESVLTSKTPHAEVLIGNVLEMMELIPSNSIQCVMTSPPYLGLRNYELPPQVWNGYNDCIHEWGPVGTKGGGAHTQGPTTGITGTKQIKQHGAMSRFPTGQFCTKCDAWLGDLGSEPTIEMYVDHMVEIFRGVRRILRPDGTLFLNLGDSYGGSGRGPQGQGSSLGVGKNYWSSPDRREGLPSRGATMPGIKRKDLMGIPWRVALALQADGWYLRSDIIWRKGNPMPGSQQDRPTTNHEYIFMFSKRERYFYDWLAIAEKTVGTAHNRGVGVNPKAEKAPTGWDTTVGDGGHIRREGRYKQNPSFSAAVRSTVELRNARSVWEINTTGYSGSHFATFPAELVERCFLAGTSERGCCPKCQKPWLRAIRRSTKSGAKTFKMMGWKPGCKCDPVPDPIPCICFDPFTGSGTAAIVALRRERRFIGTELSTEFGAQSKKRIQEDAKPMLALIAAVEEQQTFLDDDDG